jgi:hypothetical protein
MCVYVYIYSARSVYSAESGTPFIYIHIYIYSHTHIHPYKHTHTHPPPPQTQTHTHVQFCTKRDALDLKKLLALSQGTRGYIHSYTHILIHSYTNLLLYYCLFITHTYTHTHTHTQGNSPLLLCSNGYVHGRQGGRGRVIWKGEINIIF